MKKPDNWETMTQKEKEEWVYYDSNPTGRYKKRVQEAAERLTKLVLDDAELSGMKSNELSEVFSEARRNLEIFFGQTTLGQANKTFVELPEDEISFPHSQALKLCGRA